MAHILWIRDAEPDVYRRHLQVPRARGLAEPQALGPVLGLARLDRRALGDRQPADRCDRLRPHPAADGRARAVQAARPRPVGHRSWVSSGPRRPTSWGFRPVCRWPPGPATSIRPPSGRGRSPTSTPTSTSGRRRGSRATCRSRRPTPCATWPPSPPPCRVSTWWPTSTRRPVPVSPSWPTTSSSATTPWVAQRPTATSTGCSTRWRPRWRRAPTGRCSRLG